MWTVFSVLGIFFFGVISPGADFSIVVKNSLTQGRKEGLLTALGVSTGVFIHLTYSILGLGLLIGNNPSIIYWIKILGGTYLIYLGLRSIISTTIESKSEDKRTKIKTKRSWYYEGLLTNLLNPQAALFLISIISSMIAVNPLMIIALAGFTMTLMALSWFTIVSVIFSFKAMSTRFLQHTNLINRMLGLVLIAFGLRIIIL
jgi:threonine/homoserine/homoserine lactone efflux protein